MYASILALETAPVSGVMQQPTSQYYHWVYGLNIDAKFLDSLVLRASYLERPAFKHAGYTDQEFLAYGALGGRVYKKSDLGLHSFVGAGKAWGFVKINSSEDANLPKSKERFSYHAFALAVEAAYQLGPFDLRLGHSQLIGVGDKRQREARVAWPYSTYYLSVGVPIAFGSSR